MSHQWGIKQKSHLSKPVGGGLSNAAWLIPRLCRWMELFLFGLCISLYWTSWDSFLSTSPSLPKSFWSAILPPTGSHPSFVPPANCSIINVINKDIKHYEPLYLVLGAQEKSKVRKHIYNPKRGHLQTLKKNLPHKGVLWSRTFLLSALFPSSYSLQLSN